MSKSPRAVKVHSLDVERLIAPSESKFHVDLPDISGLTENDLPPTTAPTSINIEPLMS
jgi:hypothetical protein